MPFIISNDDDDDGGGGGGGVNKLINCKQKIDKQN